MVNGKDLDHTSLWRQIRWTAVVHIALTHARPKAVFVACTTNAPADGRAIVLRCRLYCAAAAQTKGDQGKQGDVKRSFHWFESITPVNFSPTFHLRKFRVEYPRDEGIVTMAERAGFEPAVGLTLRTLSRRVT